MSFVDCLVVVWFFEGSYVMGRGMVSWLCGGSSGVAW